MNGFFKTALLATALTAPLMVTAPSLWAQDRTYHDASHNDEHTWNNHEDQAYRIWVKQNHRKYATFGTLKETDQKSYWNWRHEHDDASLKIVVK
jgi:hypothetical protein